MEWQRDDDDEEDEEDDDDNDDVFNVGRGQEPQTAMFPPSALLGACDVVGRGQMSKDSWWTAILFLVDQLLRV